ncbi:TIGR02234 family membrane protein [Corynebacterium sp. H113]|uniref:TIGR02234 family membrane protein n=1 Tax=Corynebacterium sp. H113 TaxID=3133419 RepID=UPI0030B3EC13
MTNGDAMDTTAAADDVAVTDKATAETSPKKDRRPGIAQLLIALSALGMWLAGRFSWLTVTTMDDKSGSATNELVGAIWAPEIAALALTLLAGVAATLIMAGLGRRIVGAVAAVVAAGAAWPPIQLLTAGADHQRALELLTTGSATQRANAPVTVSDWAQVEELVIHNGGPIVSIIAAAVGVLGGMLLLVRPGGVNNRKSSAYENPEVRRERVREDLAAEPTSGRVLWDALDAGVDPTDMDSTSVSAESTVSDVHTSPKNTDPEGTKTSGSH